MSSAIERGARDLLVALIEQIEVLQQNIGTLLAGGTVPALFGAVESEINTTCAYGVVLNQLDGTPVPASRIQAGQHEVFVYHDGSPPTSAQVQPLAPPTVSEGRVWFTITWASGVSSGDVFEIRFPGIIVTNLDGTSHALPTQYFWGRLTELGTVASNVTAIKADLETGPNALAQVRADIAATDGKVVAAKTVIDAVKTDTTNIVALLTPEIADIKAKTDLIATTPAGVGAAMTLATDALSAAATSAAAVSKIQSGLALSSQLTDGATGLAAIKAAALAADTQTDILADAANGNAAIKAAVVQVDNQTDILAHATNGNAAIRTALDTKATPADVLTQSKAALQVPVNGSFVPAAKSLIDILSKDGSYTYDRSTDSLEAIRDFLSALQNGSTTLQALADKVSQQYVGRSAQSGTITLSAAEQVLYEQSDTVPWFFAGGVVDMTPEASNTSSVTNIRMYIKMKAGGIYRLAGSLYVGGSGYGGPYLIPKALIGALGATANKYMPDNVHNVYGVQVTAQQSTLGSGYLTIDHEWFDSKS